MRYHARLLDAMGLDGEHKLVIHGGGASGDREAATARFGAVALALPDGVRRRLTLENDEHQFGAQDVLQLARLAGNVPVVFDALHDAVHPSPDFPRRADLLQACFATWGPADGPPDTHFSTQDAAKQAGAHGWGIDGAEFARFAADTGPKAVDCMLEAKGKERALLQLRQDLASPSPTSQEPSAVP